MNRLKVLIEPPEVGDIYLIQPDNFDKAKSHGVLKIIGMRFDNIYTVIWILNPWTGESGNKHLDQISIAWLEAPNTKYLGNDSTTE